MINKYLFLSTILALSSGQIFAQEPAKTKNFVFTPASELPASARPTSGAGSSKITVINKTKDFVGLGFINAEGNLSTGYSDGSKGQTDFFIGPGSRTHKDWPFVVSNGSCFVLYSLKGKILGYGTTSETGDYEIILK
jgi:hypothetical protein